MTYATDHGNTASPDPPSEVRIKLTSSWILVGCVSAAPQWELPGNICLFKNNEHFCVREIILDKTDMATAPKKLVSRILEGLKDFAKVN